MGKWKAIFPIIAALVIAGVSSFLLYRWLQTQSVPKAGVNITATAVSVVTAKSDLIWGTKLTKDLITTIPFLKESIPAGSYSKLEDVDGRVLISALKANEPVLESKLAPKDINVGGVSAVLKNGKRAIAVAGDKVIGISGFIKPGNIVDVLVTITDPETKMETTKLVLEKVPVLATGTQIKETEKGEPSAVDVYTLEVTPEDAEKLALVSKEGKLQFALRNIMDTDTILTSGATIPETLTGLRKEEVRKPAAGIRKAAAKAASKPVVQKPPEHFIIVQEIRGDVVTEKKFSE
jgi:pilus assembly protein CpaB